MNHEREINIKVNKTIALQIQELFDEKGFDLIDNPTAFVSDFMSFDRIGGRFRYIDIGVDYTGKDTQEAFTTAPSDFTGTRYYIEEHSQKGDFPRRVTSPYGILTSYAVGADQRLYHLSNIYYFDQCGKAVKFEEVMCFSGEDDKPEDLEDTVERFTYNENEVTRTEVNISEGDSRYVPLLPGDYEKIRMILKAIETGEFVEI
ncbi:MAG: hypothetical protein Q7K55_09320 [Candidatus Levybacteria bacterium]|nr:hypothetical protein [Candidatus Levybacteria bacterium]